jgi:asparagine synthase (glutamine-hydrolysing)
MCGIAGLSLFPGNQLPFDWLSQVVTGLSHRGPDDSGVFCSSVNAVALAHTRLSILDLSSAGHQPMLSADGQVVLVFNGELYNYREIRTELSRQGYVFASASDTEVLLALYMSFRDAYSESRDNHILSRMLRRLNGIFAFALWDERFHSLLVSRDALGVKPLYFLTDKSGLFFSSESKVFDQASLPLDCGVLDRYLSYLWNPGEGSPVAGVSKLPPGEALWVSKGNIQQRFAWYQLPVFNTSRSLSSFSLDEAICGTRQHLREAVRRQLVADVPVGAFLSGGVDSSSIVAFAREENPNITCFSIDVKGGVGEGFSDDLPYARRVANHLCVPLEVVQVDAIQMAEELQTLVWLLDEPLADPAPLNVLHISRLAREQGIKVLLSGAGGDDLFSGYRRHLALENEKWWRWLPRPLRFQLRALTGHLPTSHPFTRRLRKAFSGAHLDGDARLVHYFRWIERAELQALYSPEFRFALGQARAEDPMLEFLAGLPSNTPPLEAMLALEQRFFLTDHNLTYTDKMSMAVGVEVRVPFLDPDLVEFAAQIHPQFKHRGHEGKWILKKAMEPYLPKEVIYRPKSGFGAPLRRWLKFELRDWLADTLSVDRLHRRGLFDPHAVQRLIAANSEGRIDASYTLLSLACIEIWCQYFLDGAPSPHLNSQAADS